MENLVESLPLHPFDSRPERLVGAEGLSAPMGAGVLPLATALGYATGVAAGLRDRHAEMRAHAKAGPDRVRVAAPVAVRLPLEPSTQRTEQHADIVAFGALLYELMAGSKPPRDLYKVLPSQIHLVGPEGVRAAAIGLALQCLGADGGPTSNMQRVLTEVRLYRVVGGRHRPAGTGAEAARHRPAKDAAVRAHGCRSAPAAQAGAGPSMVYGSPRPGGVLAALRYQVSALRGRLRLSIPAPQPFRKLAHRFRSPPQPVSPVFLSIREDSGDGAPQEGAVLLESCHAALRFWETAAVLVFAIYADPVLLGATRQ